MVIFCWRSSVVGGVKVAEDVGGGGGVGKVDTKPVS